MARLLFTLTVLLLVLGFQVAPALASCTYHTYMGGGRMVSCMTCCSGQSCTTTCM